MLHEYLPGNEYLYQRIERIPAEGAYEFIREEGSGQSRSPKLLDAVRQAIRARHYSRRTEKAYTSWIRRFVLFHGKKHPLEMAEPELTAFLSYPAVRRHVSASTQNQALNAMLFLYREMLRKDLAWLDGVVRAKQPKRLPVVLTTRRGAADPEPYERSSMAHGLCDIRRRAQAHRVRQVADQGRGYAAG